MTEIVLATEKHEREETTVPEITNTIFVLAYRHVLQKEIMKSDSGVGKDLMMF